MQVQVANQSSPPLFLSHSLSLLPPLSLIGTKIENETELDMLRSILAQLEFCYTVRQYDENGVPFRTYLHVPEIHPDSGMTFLEREDEGHVLKVFCHA